MYNIHFDNLLFYSYHGLHEEESILGAWYNVNIQISFSANQQIKDIKDTVNYVDVFSIVKKRMDQPTPLLETIAEDIAHGIKEAENKIQTISINIQKTNPPIAGFIGNVSVSYVKEF